MSRSPAGGSSMPSTSSSHAESGRRRRGDRRRLEAPVEAEGPVPPGRNLLQVGVRHDGGGDRVGRFGRNPVSCTVKPVAEPPYVSPADGPAFKLIRRPAWRTTMRDASNSRSGPDFFDRLAISITSSAGAFGGATMRFSARVTPRAMVVLPSG